MRGAHTVRVVRSLLLAVVAALCLGAGALPSAATAAQSISGTVTRGGLPVAGVTVDAFIPQAGTSGAPRPSFSATTGGDGRYTIALPYGSGFMVSFQPPGAQPVYYPGGTDYDDAGYVDVAAGAAVTGIDNDFPTGNAIEGTVTDADGPVAHTDVRLVDALGNGIDGGQTDDQGRYHVGPDPPGTYRVLFVPPGDRAPQYATDRATLALADPVTIVAGQTTTGVDASIHRGGHITGTVTDVGGHPLAGVTVRLHRAANPDDWLATVTTDADGRYTITGLGGEAYLVEFEPDEDGLVGTFADDHATAADADPITVPDEGTTRVDAVLHHGGQLTGRVTDDQGTPVANAQVEAHAPGGDWYDVDSDASGRYAFDSLPTGGYTLVFTAPISRDLASQYYADHTDADDADVVAVTVEHLTSGIDVRLHPSPLGRISGTVLGPGGAPMAGEHISVVSLDEPWQPSTDETTDALGHYVVHGLVPGPYSVTFWGNALIDAQLFDGRTWTGTPTPVIVAAGQERAGVDAHMTGASYTTGITGTVRDRRGVARAGSFVEVYGSGGVMVGRATTNAAGAYRIVLRAGNYRVRFGLPDGTSSWYPDAATSAASTAVTVGAKVLPLDLGLVIKAPPPIVHPIVVSTVAPVSARGRVTLGVRCPDAVRCKGNLTLTAREGSRTRRVGGTTFTVGPRRTDRRRLTLNATGRRLLRHRGCHLRVSVTVTRAETAVRTTSTITLR